MIGGKTKGLKDNILSGHIGKGHTQATVSNELHAQLLPTITSLEQTFGKDSLDGVVQGARFIGDENQRVPFVGTLYDIMQRPQLYDLTPEQRTLLQNIQVGKSANLSKYKGQYGFELGEFPTSEGAVHLPNVDNSRVGIEMAGDERAALTRGRTKERFYETGADRWLHDKALADAGKLSPDKVFKPNTNVAALLNADNETLASLSSQEVLKTALGGKTRAEVIQEVRPDLFNKMDFLKRRLAKLKGYENILKSDTLQAVEDFLKSGIEGEDLEAVRAALDIKLQPGRYVAKSQAGKDLATVQKEIDGIRQQIRGLAPSWKTVNPRGYVLIQEGGLYRYFLAEDARHIRRLLETSKSPLLRNIDELRTTAFGGDLSPATIQGLNGWFMDPIGASKTLGKEVGMAAGEKKFWRPFTVEGLASDVRNGSESWNRFTMATGLNPLGAFQKEEFGAGFLTRIPKVGKYWQAANDAVFRPLVKTMKDSFDSIYESGIKSGLSPEMASAIAADDVTKVIPSYSYRRLGMSQAEAAHRRAALTSVSFLTQPIALNIDAIKGLLRLGSLHKPTPSESFAIKRVMTLAAMVSAISATSGALYAQRKGRDPVQQAREGVNPGSPYFWSLMLPDGGRIGLGGPERSLIKAVAPGEVSGVPVPVPFAGIVRYLQSKAHPVIRITADEIRNKDFFDRTIRTGEFPVNVLQGLEYAGEGSLPLALGAGVENLRTGTPGQIPQSMASQFAGVNLAPQLKLDKEMQLAQQKFPGQVNPNEPLPPKLKGQIAMTPEMRAFELERGRVTPEKELKWRQIDQQKARDTELENYWKTGQGMTPKEWRNELANSLGASAAINEYKKALGVFKDKEPKDPNESARWNYYRLLVYLGDTPTGQLKENAGEIIDDYFSVLTPDQLRYLKNNIHPNATPVVDAYYEAKELLKPYFDITRDPKSQEMRKLRQQVDFLKAKGDILKATRLEYQKGLNRWENDTRAKKLKLRHQKPALDKLLVKWGYVSRSVK